MLLRVHHSMDDTSCDGPQIAGMREAASYSAACRLWSAEVHFTRAILDATPNAVLLLSPRCEIAFASRAAIALLAARDGIRLRAPAAPRLALDDQTQQERFGVLVDTFTGPSHAAGAVAGLRVPRPTGKPDYVVQLKALEQPAESEGRVAVLITDPCEHHRLDAAVLEAVYGITAAEARLAEALLGDYPVCEIARKFGIKESTARSQLLGIFRKTRTSRQTQLIKLLMGLRAS
jgi:DNA-binding CsgD family transcriptional regulator